MGWLDMSPGSLLVDLACGRGGPGLWLARQIGAALVGVELLHRGYWPTHSSVPKTLPRLNTGIWSPTELHRTAR